jgi:hypothetical protein
METVRAINELNAHGLPCFLESLPVVRTEKGYYERRRLLPGAQLLLTAFNSAETEIRRAADVAIYLIFTIDCPFSGRKFLLSGRKVSAYRRPSGA